MLTNAQVKRFKHHSVMIYLGDSDSDYGLVVLRCVRLCSVGLKTDYVDMQALWFVDCCPVRLVVMS